MRSVIQDLMRGEVHVWHASPDAPGTSPASCLGLLSPDEHERLEAFAFERDRELFLLGKALLRTVLGRYFDMPATEWRFVSTALGKPHIDRPESTRSLQFSLSHTEGLVACAVRWQRAVGIDVEYTGRGLAWDRVAHQFAPEEYQQLARRPQHKRREAFFALWTLKEAYAKACGHGLSQGLNACRFELAEDCSVRAAYPDRGESTWTFFCPRLSREHRVAVAAEHSADVVPQLRVCIARIETARD
jgi:4'-phosphopantetheinyl transferase